MRPQAFYSRLEMDINAVSEQYDTGPDLVDAEACSSAVRAGCQTNENTNIFGPQPYAPAKIESIVWRYICG